MSYKFVDPDKVSKPPTKNAPGQAKYFHQLLEELPDDKVAVLTVAEGKSARGIKVSVGRVASSKGMKVVSWDNSEDGKDATEVYVKKV